ncbi:MAG TPA: hypothetical protein VH593_19660 [Ktedonobacteraceae bacterium]|jgi:hypothetical protein
MAKQKYQDFPLAECANMANKYIAGGAKVYQKFTCEKCGARLTIDQPNTFYESADCDRCGAVTDIKKNGCNYMMVTGGL